jgi:Ca2+-binding RTX toxin-like protein
VTVEQFPASPLSAGSTNGRFPHVPLFRLPPIGGGGRDKLDGGSEADKLSGGAGRDFINSANGRDKASGGKGNDAINVSTAGPAAKVKCGKGKDIVRYNHNERRRIKGCERRYSIK